MASRKRTRDAEMGKGKVILVALGGNAIKQASEAGTGAEQFRSCRVAAACLAKLVKTFGPDDRLVITHGNGPQAGNLLVQQDAGMAKVPAQPMDIVGAMTQGQIGYMLQNSMQEALAAEGLDVPVAAIVNQVLVDPKDKEFEGENASKPVGNFFTEAEAMKLKAENKDWIVKKVKPGAEKGWRRVVPSPDPIRNCEADAIRRMVKAGIIVIASGGGGIPVVQDGKNLRGVEAVIDKDLAGQRLAEVVQADVFVILTDVEQAVLNYKKPGEKPLGTITLAEAQKYLAEGHFLAGSMGPKVKACTRFVEAVHKKAVITSLDKILDAMEGQTGTHIVP